MCIAEEKYFERLPRNNGYGTIFECLTLKLIIFLALGNR